MTLIELPKETTPDVPTWVSSLDNPITINPQGVAVKEFTELPSDMQGGRNLFKGYGGEEIQLKEHNALGSFTQFTTNLTFDPAEHVGKTFTISFYAKSPNGTTALNVYNQNSTPRYFYFHKVLDTALGTEWKYYTYTFVNIDRAPDITTVSNKIEIYAPTKTGVLVKNIKLEIGSDATPWSPAPEDLGYVFPQWIQNGNPAQFNPEGVAIKELVEIPSELVGGRNLLRYSGNFKDKTGWTTGTVGVKDGFPVLTGVGGGNATTQVQGADMIKVPLEPSTTYVFSAEVMYSADVTQTSTPLHYHWFSDSLAQGAVVSTGVISTQLHKANTWGVAAIRVRTKDTLSADAYFRPFINATPVGVTVWVKNFKLEKGTEATPWSPAPEDLGYDLPHWIQNFDTPIQYHTEGVAVKEV